MSSPVTTRYTPPTTCAALTSMRLMRPWAMLLRKIFPYSIPGRRRLCTYSARPATLSQDSRRGTERPTCGVSVDWVARFIDRPLEKYPQQLFLVFGRAVEVALDFQLADILFTGYARRAIGRRRDEDPVVTAEHHRHAHRRPVVGRARGALEVGSAALAERRNLHVRNQLPGLQRGFEIPR